MGEHTCADHIDPPREIARDVRHRFTLADPDLLGREIHRSPAELDHGDLEGDPGPERRLLEDEGHGVARERRHGTTRLLPSLQLGGEGEEPRDVVSSEIADRQEMLHVRTSPSARSTMSAARSSDASSTMSGGARRKVLSPAVSTSKPRSRHAARTSPTGTDRSTPISKPLPRTSLTTFGLFDRTASRRSDSRRPMRAARSGSRSSTSVLNTVSPTAVANGLPPNVLP